MRVPDPLLHDEIVRNAAWVRRLAATLTQGQDPDDLAQETWLALLEAPPPEGASARPWLAGIARNLARMRRRGKGRRRRREAEAAAGTEHEAAGAEALLEQVEAQQQLGRLLLGLDEPFRATVRLRYEEGLTAAEIARREGIPAGTVRWRLKEGLDRVRAAMEREEGREGARRRLWLLAFGPELGSGARPGGGAAGALRPGPEGVAARSQAARARAGGPRRRGVSPRSLVAGLALPALLGLVGLALLRRGPPPAPRERARPGASPAPQREAALAPPGARRTKPAGPRAPVARAAFDPGAVAGAIGGVVLDSNAKRGVAGARLVFARGDESFEVEAGEGGAFAFVAETPGAYALVSAHAEGYFAFAPEWGQSPVVAVARPSRRVEGLSVYLEAAHDYRGLVVGPAGEPVAGAQIGLREPPHRERAPDPLPERYTTDRAGAFWFRAPEGAALEATGPGYGGGQALLDQGVVSSRELTIRLPRGDAGPGPRREALAGRVVDEAGEPVAGALVRGEPEADGGSPPEPTLTDAAGRFAFPALAAGAYRLLVARGGGVPRAFAGQRTGETGARLVLRRGGAVEGRVVRAAGGEPVPSFTLFLTEPLGLGRRPVNVRAVVDPEGRFRLDDVPEGPYHLLALAAGFGASAERPLRVSAGEASAPSDLALPDGGSLRGRVVAAEDGRPIEGAWVDVYRPALSGPDVLPPSRVVLTDAEGAFTLHGVEPGLRSIMVGAAGRHRRLLSGIVVEEGAEAEPALVPLPAPAPGEAPGTYLGGLGAIYQATEDAMKILSAWPGGGAAEAGLAAGDEIVALDGVPIVELGSDEFLERSRAPEQGVPARVLVRRAGRGPAVELVVPRRLVRR
ncbi:MAG TPA: sigma-70 family RNA polymerase sigma factor [Polyangiaceae bacterium]|nr:sigma-70 family RNA polymerase sigma factor [Polyangiaceae bacterium]